MKNKLLSIYNLLLESFGFRNWWPAETKEEIIIGAILTQNVAWRNVKKAINNLDAENLLSLESLHKRKVHDFSLLIKPTRFYNQKANKIKNFTNLLFGEFDGDLDKMFSLDINDLRSLLLKINGIGKETADSIILYAGKLPKFVCDAYTKRIFSRLGYVSDTVNYETLQKLFEENLPQDVDLFNDFHAQIVTLGHRICKNKPKCSICPLRNICEKRFKLHN